MGLVSKPKIVRAAELSVRLKEDDEKHWSRASRQTILLLPIIPRQRHKRQTPSACRSQRAGAKKERNVCRLLRPGGSQINEDFQTFVIA